MLSWKCIGCAKATLIYHHFGNLRKGVRINLPQVSYHNANEVLIKSNDSCGIEADGEYVGLAPATLSVVPKAIRFLMPPDVQ